jgi:O-acetyl-ADP-ribose deacetylase (regulator of RNase III)
MKLILFDISKDVYTSFKNHFGQHKNVEIELTSLENLKNYDCVVSPANSFGLMNGGLDKYLSTYFGSQLESRVQQHIKDEFYGEQPVGTSFIIETNHKDHPFLAHTPTMRIPSKIIGGDTVYKAMRAMLIAVDKYNKLNDSVISSVACSGLGTMIGGLSPEIAVRQMELAYRYYLNPITITNWFEGRNLQTEIDNTLI